jgi:hypothetical protein
MNNEIHKNYWPYGTGEISISDEFISNDEYEEIRKLSQESANTSRQMIETRAQHSIFGCPDDCKTCLPPSNICPSCGKTQENCEW